MPKINFTGVSCVDDAGRARNVEAAERLGLPSVHKKYPVAVVGGGGSISDHIETLREWPGEVWAINATIMWCKQNGIRATFVTSDPDVVPDDYPVWLGPGDNAMVAIHCSPGLYERIRLAKVRTYRTGYDAINTGPTTATAMPFLALTLGHPGAVFFGCESSYCSGVHAYADDPPRDLMQIRCKDHDFLTKPELILQAECLGRFLHEFPDQFSERSGGLLRAMIGQSDYDVLAVSRAQIRPGAMPRVQAALDRIKEAAA